MQKSKSRRQLTPQKRSSSWSVRASAIERVAVAVQDAAERLRSFDLSPLSEALASFERSAARTKSLSGTVSGWRDEVEGVKASAEATVAAIGDLSLRQEDVAQGLRERQHEQ